MSVNSSLPIFAYENAIVEALRDNQVVVVAADPGAGKSTAVPMMLHEAGFAQGGMIGTTEPRRVAAMALARYVAEQNDGKCGDTVGFQIGGVRELSRRTVVKYMTEGILLRELHGNPGLGKTNRHPGYSVVIADEVHERGINQDLILALMKDVLRNRSDLKLVVMSATIDEHRFSEHFDGAPVIKVPGRMHPVEVRWASGDCSARQMSTRAAEKVVELLNNGERGDILVFMPDERSIKEVCSKVEEQVSAGYVKVLPLYGNQAPEDQQEAMRPRRERRVIVATNIAETSLTIEGVVHVVDTGLIKQVQYVSATMSALEVCEHSKAGCEQRKGRAGRTQAGICHRLYTQENYRRRDAFTKPEILRTSLDSTLLHLMCLGYSMDDVFALELMDKPDESVWREAQELLTALGALDADCEVTDSGRLMEKLSMTPMLARMVLSAQEFACTEEIATIAAGLISRPVFFRPKGHEAAAKQSHVAFMDLASDGHTILNVYRAWRRAHEDEFNPREWARDKYLSSHALHEIDRNREQILAMLSRNGIPMTSAADKMAIEKAVASGLMYNLCIRDMRNSYTCGEQGDVYIYPGSSCFPPHHEARSGRVPNPDTMVCAELWKTSKTFARGITVIQRSWIKELLPAAALQVSYELRRPLISYGVDHTVLRKVSWRHHVLEEGVVESFGDDALIHIAADIAKDVSGWASLSQERSHPSVPQMRATYEALRQAWTEHTGVSMHDMTASDTAVIKDTVVLAVALQLRGCTTVAEVQARSLRLIPQAHVPSEDESVCAAVAARVDALLAAQADDLAAAERARSERQAAEMVRRDMAAQARAARELDVADVRARIKAVEELATRLDDRGIPMRDFKYKISDLNRQCGYDWKTVSQLTSDIGQIERSVNLHAKKFEADIALTRQAWELVDATFPTCPLCDGTWRDFGHELRCNGDHDIDRVLKTDASRTIGMFVTNRDEKAARIEMYGVDVVVRVSAARDSVWALKKFKSVEYVPVASILPAELVDQRDEILEMLDELQKAQRALEATLEGVKALRVRAKFGEVVKLRFIHIAHQAQSRVSGMLYRSKWVENYPADGETWYCTVTGSTTVERSDLVHEVVPEIKVTGEGDETFIEELREMIVDGYPGLPAELLN